jgi:transcriptional regulator with GAF, ATPase, and Fis domain
LEAENTFLKEEINLQHDHGGFIGQSPPIKKVLSQAEQVACTDTTVLLLGETDTGRELLAREINNLSQRKGRTMVAVSSLARPYQGVEKRNRKGCYHFTQKQAIGGNRQNTKSCRRYQ